MVAYFHALEQLPQYNSLLSKYFLGGAHLSNGVDLFFVITGLLLLAPWTPSLLRTAVPSVEYFAKSLLFIPCPNGGQSGQFYPLLVPGWPLNLEMFLYGSAISGSSSFLFGMIIARIYVKHLPRWPSYRCYSRTDFRLVSSYSAYCRWNIGCGAGHCASRSSSGMLPIRCISVIYFFGGSTFAVDQRRFRSRLTGVRAVFCPGFTDFYGDRRNSGLPIPGTAHADPAAAGISAKVATRITSQQRSSLHNPGASTHRVDSSARDTGHTQRI